MGVIATLKEIQKISRHGNCRMITITEVKVLVKGRKDAKDVGLQLIPTPSKLVGLHKITNMVSSIGNDYYKVMERNGADVELYHGIKKDYTPSVEVDTDYPSLNGIIQRNIKNPDQKYIRVYPSLCSNVEVETIFIDESGSPVEVTKEEKDAFFQTRPKEFGESTESQALSGCEKNPEPRNYKAEGILYLQKGSVVINNLSKHIMNLLNLEVVE